MDPKSTHADDHIERDMDVLRRRLRRMADLVLTSLDDSVAAMANRDRRLAYHVVLQDNRVDVLERHIDRLCQEFLVRHMPVAARLRFVMAAAKVNSELERIGDYAESIALRAVTLSKEAGMHAEDERIVEMSKIAFQMLRQAVNAFIDGNADLAARTIDLDRQVDKMNAAIFDSLAHPPAEERDLTPRFALLGLLGRIERVADRAVNIAEEAVYVVRGQVLRHLPRHDFRVLFVCETNSSLSQMAEGIARSLAPSHFIFQSAGTSPQPVDRATVRYLSSEGIDISRQRSKGLADVGSIDDFNVVVTLSLAADHEVPDVPYRSVLLDWELSSTASEEADDAARFRPIVEELRTKITELVDGLLGSSAEHEEGL